MSKTRSVLIGAVSLGMLGVLGSAGLLSSAQSPEPDPEACHVIVMDVVAARGDPLSFHIVPTVVADPTEPREPIRLADIVALLDELRSGASRPDGTGSASLDEPILLLDTLFGGRAAVPDPVPYDPAN